uniref:Transmembrane protein 254 n=1 Tax=Felis catus TaxID=9685 RepID=A0ABI7Z5K6_FELCA
MVVTKSEAGRAASGYFRRARRLPSLVTVLALGYFAVRSREGWCIFLGPPGPRRARGAQAARSRACASGGCLGYCRKRKVGGLTGRFLLHPSLLCVLSPPHLLRHNRWVVFWPQSIPYQSLGPLGLFTQYLVDRHHTLLRSGYWLAWLIHVGEALYAMVLCKSKGITDGRAQVLWFLQTFLFGVASLSILIAYRPKRQKQT